MKASIDIGTNTVLLLVGTTETNRVQVLEEQQRIPRLGTDVDQSGILSSDSIDRVISVLRDFKGLVEQKYPAIDNIFVTATSAVRDAKNRRDLIEAVKENTGLQVHVLSGLEEAEFTFAGALSMLDDNESIEKNVIVDIGGGSTEIAHGKREIEDRYSFDMGCVRFTERFLSDDPPTQDQIKKCRKAVNEVFEEHHFNFKKHSFLIGVGGTVTSLAYMQKQMDQYDSRQLSGHIITRDAMQKVIQKLKMNSSTILFKEYPTVMEGRADIFLAGLLILDEFMSTYNFNELATSTGGIRHGTLLAK